MGSIHYLDKLPENQFWISEPKAEIWITESAFKEIGDYSRSQPTGPSAGRIYRKNFGWREDQPDDWWIFIVEADEQPGYVKHVPHKPRVLDETGFQLLFWAVWERKSLWTDLAEATRRASSAGQIEFTSKKVTRSTEMDGLIARLQSLSAILGPIPWRQIPPSTFSWYESVEGIELPPEAWKWLVSQKGIADDYTLRTS